MTSKIKLIVAMDMLFLLFLALSGSAGGIASEMLYYLAFLLPTALALNDLYGGDKISHDAGGKATPPIISDLKKDFSFDKKCIFFFLPTILPAIAVIIALSLLTSLFMGLFGFENITAFEEPFILAVITHALVPAILEELLFRFAPIKLMRENRKSALLISSLMFAFAHANLFQIPYAFLAGVIFSALYLMTGSIIPSIILHFLNNLFSLISLYGYLSLAVYIPLFALLLISLIVLVKKRACYIKEINSIFKSGEKCEFSYYPFIFIATSLVLALSSLFY